MQTSQASPFYDAKREAVVLGTIVEYKAAHSVDPFEAHATVQTSSGLVDVQLGRSHFLEANHLSLAAGDSVRLIGVSVANDQSCLFLARIVQAGAQSLVIRNVRGIRLFFSSSRLGGSQSPRGAL
ncbi:MAG: hypothetical protein PVS2B2_11030 [Candidatus Acidiferrum sp.]